MEDKKKSLEGSKRFTVQKKKCDKCDSDIDDLIKQNFSLFNTFFENNDYVSIIFGYIKTLLYKHIKDDESLKELEGFYDRIKKYPISFKPN